MISIMLTKMRMFRCATLSERPDASSRITSEGTGKGSRRTLNRCQGRICEIDPRRSFGRIETEDGRLFYFHRNSLAGGRLEDLVTGLRVRFSEQPGNLGPQASGVHVLSPQ
jgi:cold shock CspA family protein